MQTALGAEEGDEAEDTLLAKAAASHPWPPAETAVTNLRAESDESDLSLTLSWDPPTYETDFQIRDYRYRIDYRNWVTVPSNARSQRIDNTSDSLSSGRRYRFQVRARFGTRSNGFAGRKATIRATAPGDTVAAVPGQPRNLSYEFIGDIVHLTWTAATRGGSELLRWEVRVSNGPWWSTNSTRPGWAYGPHDPGLRRAYSVRGVNRHGAGPALLIFVDREQLSNVVPGFVRNFTHTKVGRHQYRLSWTRPERFDPDDPVTRYHIYRNTCQSSTYIQPYVPSDRDRVEFSAILTYFLGDGDLFNMEAGNSSGIGQCIQSTAVE